MSQYKAKILFLVSGSVSAYKCANVLSQLVQQGHEVQVIASPSALKFVGAATWEGLSGRAVFSEMFQDGHMMDHIEWTRWADLAVLCPASANSINTIAAGLSSSLISSLALAWNRAKPFLVFPAMNTKMLEHPATTEALIRLQSWGLKVYPTQSGRLACGDIGFGKLLEPEQILIEIQSHIYKLNRKLGQILITAGGTREMLDEVRCLTNISSGRTGCSLAETLTEMGWDVTLLRAKHGEQPKRFVPRQIEFTSFDDLADRMQEELSKNHFDAAIHLAAVSDFHLGQIFQDGKEISASVKRQKISSDQELSIQLIANPKLLDRIQDWSLNRKIFVVGFKLTVNQTDSQLATTIHKMLSSQKIHAVVHNEASTLNSELNHHPFQVYSQDGTRIQGRSKTEMSTALHQLLIKQFSPMEVSL